MKQITYIIVIILLMIIIIYLYIFEYKMMFFDSVQYGHPITHCYIVMIVNKL